MQQVKFIANDLVQEFVELIKFHASAILQTLLTISASLAIAYFVSVLSPMHVDFFVVALFLLTTGLYAEVLARLASEKEVSKLRKQIKEM